MKIFANKKVIQKIMLFIVFIILFNFIAPNFAFADSDDDENVNTGGLLFKPLTALVTGIGDGLIKIMQKGMMNTTMIGYHTDTDVDWWNIFTGFLTYSNPILTMFATIDNIKSGNYLKAIPIVGYVSNIDENIDRLFLPLIIYSPSAIFSNDVPALDVNFINPHKYDITYTGDDGKEHYQSSAAILQNVVSTWYVVLRNIAIVGLLSVLVYIGIRIVISSTSPEKAKYKQMITDWVVALCLLFFMQYIMSFSINIVEAITDSLKEDTEDYYSIQLPKEVTYKDENGDDVTTDKWAVNLISQARFNTQADDSSEAFGNAVIYLVLVCFTAYFTVMYLKRVIYMAFLTMIAPLVALTYPIDKINDGKAQAFDMWLKEYIFNLLIQPMHLILYRIIVISALTLVSDNLIYGLVAIAFMMPAEKLLRKMFGFDKAGATTGAAGSFASGALFSTVAGKLASGAKSIGKSSKGGKPEGGNKQLRTADNRKKDDDAPGITDGYESRSGVVKQQKDEKKAEKAPELNEQGAAMQALIDRDNEESNKTTTPPKGLMSGKSENETLPNGNANVETTPSEESSNNRTLPNNRLRTNNTRNKIKPNIRSGLAAVGKHYVNKNNGKKVLKGAAKLAGKATLGAAAGAVGLGVGLSTGDMSKVGKYTGMGVAGGVALAHGAGKLGGKAINEGNNIKDTFNRGAYTIEQREQLKNEKLDKDFINDRETIEFYQSKFGDRAQDIMNNEALEMRRRGITDNEAIAKAVQNMDKGKYKNQDEMYRVAQVASQASDYKQMDRYKDQFKDALINKGWSEEDAENESRRISKLAGDLNGFNLKM